MISWRNFENEARLTSGREAYEILYNAWKERRTLISNITVGINIFGPTFDLAPERLATRRGESNYAKADKVFAGVVSIAESLTHFISKLWFTNDGEEFFRFENLREICAWIGNDDGMMLPGLDEEAFRLIAPGDIRILITLYRIIQRIRYVSYYGDYATDALWGKEKHAESWWDGDAIWARYSTGNYGTWSDPVFVSAASTSSSATYAKRAAGVNMVLPLAQWGDDSKVSDELYSAWGYDSDISIGKSTMFEVEVSGTYPLKYRNLRLTGGELQTRYLKFVEDGDKVDEFTEEPLDDIPLKSVDTCPEEWTEGGDMLFPLILRDGSEMEFPPDPSYEISGDDASITLKTIRYDRIAFNRIADLSCRIVDYPPIGVA